MGFTGKSNLMEDVVLFSGLAFRGQFAHLFSKHTIFQTYQGKKAVKLQYGRFIPYLERLRLTVV